MVRARILAATAACVVLAAGPAAAQGRSGPWVRMMTWEARLIGREAAPPSAVADGIEAWTIVAWGAPLPDGSVYMLGRLRVNCGARQAAVMEAISMSPEGRQLSHQFREQPDWDGGAPGTPVATLISLLCDRGPAEDGPLFTDTTAFVAAANNEPPAP